MGKADELVDGIANRRRATLFAVRAFVLIFNASTAPCSLDVHQAAEAGFRDDGT